MKPEVKIINKLVRDCAHIEKCPQCGYFKQTAQVVGACLKYNRYIEFQKNLPEKEAKEGEDEN